MRRLSIAGFNRKTAILRRGVIPNPAWLPPIQKDAQRCAPTGWPVGNRGYGIRIRYEIFIQQEINLHEAEDKEELAFSALIRSAMAEGFFSICW